jgi:hypothetical protein
MSVFVNSHHVDADPYSTYHPNADLDFLFDTDADPGYQNDADRSTHNTVL